MSPHRLSFSNDDSGSSENDISDQTGINVPHLPSSTNSRKERENVHN